MKKLLPIAGLLLLGVVSWTVADDTPPRPWEELYKAFLEADREHGDLSTELDSVRVRIKLSEEELAPFFADEARLASICAPGDPRLADAARRRLAKAFVLKIGEDRIREARLLEKKLETSELAIQLGDRAQQRILAYLERMGIANVGTRTDQVMDAERRLLEVNHLVDNLESQGTPRLPAFTPLGKGQTPRQIADLIKIYEEDAKSSAAVAARLKQRVEAKNQERELLMKLLEKGAKLEGQNLPERLKVVEASIKEIEPALAAAAKRVDDLHQEIQRLEQRRK